MFDLVMSALHATPPSRGAQSMGEDIVWKLERHSSKLIKEIDRMPQREEERREDYKHQSVDRH
jgi:hypothetical protein